MRLRDLVTDQCVRRRATSALAALIVALPCLALATPPAWAPAHGWR
jgi:ABC-type spermidine/putrescine transport system permease subunit I